MRLAEEWNGLPDEAALTRTANELGMWLLCDRSEHRDFEDQRWTLTAARSWPAPAPLGLQDATTAEVRAYLVGMYEMKRWHQARLREIREAMEALT